MYGSFCDLQHCSGTTRTPEIHLCLWVDIGKSAVVAVKSFNRKSHFNQLHVATAPSIPLLKTKQIIRSVNTFLPLSCIAIYHTLYIDHFLSTYECTPPLHNRPIKYWTIPKLVPVYCHIVGFPLTHCVHNVQVYNVHVRTLYIYRKLTLLCFGLSRNFSFLSLLSHIVHFVGVKLAPERIVNPISVPAVLLPGNIVGIISHTQIATVTL